LACVLLENAVLGIGVIWRLEDLPLLLRISLSRILMNEKNLKFSRKNNKEPSVPPRAVNSEIVRAVGKLFTNGNIEVSVRINTML
jgi:hypothetical protein